MFCEYIVVYVDATRKGETEREREEGRERKGEREREREFYTWVNVNRAEGMLDRGIDFLGG